MHRLYALLELACMRGAHVMLALAIVFTRKRLAVTPPPANPSHPFSWHDLDQGN
jgi:hypothetical protein